MSYEKRVGLTLFAASFAFVGGCVGSALLSQPDFVRYAHSAPMPYHVPQFQGGVALRLAMVHDVIHERFPKHGPAFYRERERLAREKLKTLSPDSDEALALADDIGAGLERQGQSEDAAKVLREKLTRQEKKGLSGRVLYTSYANLGTFMAHANVKKAIGGDPEAKERFKEGLDYVRKSIQVNPEAHFGRETWQVALGEFIVAAIDQPEILKEFDFVGDHLNAWVDPAQGRPTARHGGHTSMGWGYESRAFYVDAMRNPEAVSDLFEQRAEIRLNITKIGAEGRWTSITGLSQKNAVPFDEPVLGIIGMWRQGGGANPHFALCLGEIMLRVGQRYIAWCAFERASRLADKFLPKPDFQQFLREHCANRQKEIEATLSPNEVQDLRPRFEAELAFGEQFQTEYQEYESKKIAASDSINDEHFFDEFNNGREPIATPAGPEEWYVTQVPNYLNKLWYLVSWGLFASGATAMSVALLLRRRAQ